MGKGSTSSSNQAALHELQHAIDIQRIKQLLSRMHRTTVWWESASEPCRTTTRTGLRWWFQSVGYILQFWCVQTLHPKWDDWRWETPLARRGYAEFIWHFVWPKEIALEPVSECLEMLHTMPASLRVVFTDFLYDVTFWNQWQSVFNFWLLCASIHSILCLSLCA